MTLKEAILIGIRTNPGIKGVELVMAVMALMQACNGSIHAFNAIDYFTLIELMIADGDVVELQYVLSEMPYKVKTMYFPKGTSFGEETVQTEAASNGAVGSSQPAGSVAAR